jgi:hypothetical protein
VAPLLTTLPDVAVIVVVPIATVVATPVLAIVATAVFEDVHVTTLVTLNVPFGVVAIAVYGTVTPVATLVVVGVTEMD